MLRDSTEEPKLLLTAQTIMSLKTPLHAMRPAEFKTVKKGVDDNPELEDVTTVKLTIVAKSNVNERTVTEPDPTKSAPGTTVQRVEHSPHEVNTDGDEKLKDELVDENNNK